MDFNVLLSGDTQLRGTMNHTDEDYKDIKDDLREILKLLNGNGKIGICAKVEIVWGTGVFLIVTVLVQAAILTRLLMTQ